MQTPPMSPQPNKEVGLATPTLSPPSNVSTPKMEEEKPVVDIPNKPSTPIPDEPKPSLQIEIKKDEPKPSLQIEIKKEESKPKPNTETNKKYKNWAMVWAKQQGYPNWPAHVIVTEELSEEQRKPLSKFMKEKKEGEVLVRFIDEGYQFGWVNEEQIKPFEENFEESITQRMLEDDKVVKVIQDALKVNPTEKSKLLDKALAQIEKERKEKERVMEECKNIDLGLFIVDDMYYQPLQLKLTVNKAESDVELLKKLREWESMDKAELNKMMYKLLHTPFTIETLTDSNNKIAEVLKQIMSKSNDMEIISLAECLFERCKDEVKASIRAGDYNRCKEHIYK